MVEPWLDALAFAGFGNLAEVWMSAIRDKYFDKDKPDLLEGKAPAIMSFVYASIPLYLHVVGPHLQGLAEIVSENTAAQAAMRAVGYGISIAGCEYIIGRTIQKLHPDGTCPWEHRYAGQPGVIGNGTVRLANIPIFIALGGAGDFIHQAMHSI
jgi:hypothetical protein